MQTSLRCHPAFRFLQSTPAMPTTKPPPKSFHVSYEETPVGEWFAVVEGTPCVVKEGSFMRAREGIRRALRNHLRDKDAVQRVVLEEYVRTAVRVR